MENAKLDYEEIFVLRPLRKNAKTKPQGIKYLDRPFPAIKPARSVLFNAKYTRFAMVTDKNVYVFDNFTKQNIFKVCIDDLELHKLLFFRDDLVALCPDGMYYFQEHEDEANYRFKRLIRRSELEEPNLFDLENVNDMHVLLTASNTVYAIRFVPSKGKVHPEVQYMISLGGARKLKYLHKNSDLATLYPGDAHRTTSELMMFLDYTNPAALRYLILDKEFKPHSQYNVVNMKLEDDSESKESSESNDPEDNSEPEAEESKGLQTPNAANLNLSQGGMELEHPDRKQVPDTNQPFEVKNIDNLIVVPKTNQVLIVDLAHGVFLADFECGTSPNPATLRPFWKLDQFEKIKFRCACLCFDKNRIPLLCMFTLRQTHQHLLFRPLSKSGSKHDTGCEISESKVKAKKVFFNPLWNAFMILDFDESYYLMEFYNLNYYEKYYIRFKAIDENQVYTEEETEFDERRPIVFNSTPESEADLVEAINGRPTNHPLLQPSLNLRDYRKYQGL